MLGRALHNLRTASARPADRARYAYLSLPAVDYPALHDEQATSALHRSKYNALIDSLRRRRLAPSNTWGSYIDYISIRGSELIPLQLHQDVLRKCVPPAQAVRTALSKRLRDKPDQFEMTYAYEGRLQTVIRNMRTSGFEPSRSDYNFVLEQFAAVGHHLGTLRVLHEMKRVKVVPSLRTYSLCLQSIAHRLTLPCEEEDLPRIHKETSDICLQLLHEMWNARLPMSSINLDLAFRIMKETLDREGLDWLLKMAYGIDLAYPDHLPLEVLSKMPKGPNSASPGYFTGNMPSLHPFSTAALNTAVDLLGRAGDISRLVQTFEVLTRPLPPQSGRFFSTVMEEDDDDSWGEMDTSEEDQKLRRIPHADPNTATYTLLIRHLSKTGHAVLARHYLWEAVTLSEDVDRRLRGDCIRTPLETVLAPHISVTPRMVVSVMGLANRTKDVPMMRWLKNVTARSLKRKQTNLVFYTNLQRQLEKQYVDSPEPLLSSTITTSDAEEANTAHKTTPPSSEPLASSPEPPKPFDVPLHINILSREIEGLTPLQAHIDFLISRTTQRIKERLGRRVWAGKDIWLRSEGNMRRGVGKQQWKEEVNFRVEKSSRRWKATPAYKKYRA